MSKLIELMDMWLAMQETGGSREEAYRAIDLIESERMGRNRRPWDADPEPKAIDLSPQKKIPQVRLRICKNMAGDEEVHVLSEIELLRNKEKRTMEIDEEIRRIHASEVKAMSFMNNPKKSKA